VSNRRMLKVATVGLVVVVVEERREWREEGGFI
jgi:hypothetical protein